MENTVLETTTEVVEATGKTSNLVAFIAGAAVTGAVTLGVKLIRKRKAKKIAIIKKEVEDDVEAFDDNSIEE